jgi:Chaperone of endosialidase
MYGWIQSGWSNTAFSNVGSNDLVIRTENTSERIIMGAGKDSTKSATLYINSNAVGVRKLPDIDSLLDVAGIFKVKTNNEVRIETLISAPDATFCNVTVEDITSTTFQTTELSTSTLNTTNIYAPYIHSETVTSSNIEVQQGITVGTGIYPSCNMMASLGDVNNKFSDLWIGGRLLHLSDIALNQDDDGNLKVLDISETFMKRIVVADTQIGTSSEPLRLTQSNDGRFAVYKVVNNQEQPLNLIDNMWPFESNIGIGIQSPTERLDIDGNIKVTGNVIINGKTALSNDTYANTLIINPNEEYIEVHAKGNAFIVPSKLGVGVSQPLFPLDVAGTIRTDTIQISSNNLSFLDYTLFVDDEQTIPWYGVAVPSLSSNLYLSGKDGIRLLASNTPIVMDPLITGLGVGTDVVNTLLQLKNDDNWRKIVLKELANNDYQNISIGTSNDSMIFQLPSPDGNYEFYTAVDDTIFYRVLTIQGDGNIRIGSSTDRTTVALDVEGTIRSGSTLLLGDSLDSQTYGRVFAAGNALLLPEEEITMTFGKDYTFYNQAVFTYRHIGENDTSNLVLIGHYGNETSLVIEASGNVGIGTTVPVHKLDVRGDLYADQVKTTDLVAVDALNSTLNIGCDSVTEVLNIAIGTNKTINLGGDGTVINLVGDVTWVNTENTRVLDKLITLNVGGSSNANDCGIEFEGISDSQSNIVGYIKTNMIGDAFVMKAPLSSNILNIDLNNGVKFNELVHIHTSSNIGLGTASNPQYNVHIQNSNAPYLMVETLSNDISVLGLGNSNTIWQFIGPVYDSNDALQISYYDKINSTSTTHMSIVADGSIGIGTASPGYLLDVNGTLNAKEILVNGEPVSTSISGGGGGTSAGWGVQGSNIYTECNLGIWKRNPQYTLDVAGSINACNFLLQGQPFTGGYWTTNEAVMYTLSNLGVGKTIPEYTLDVGGTLNALDILINGQPLSSGFWQLQGGNMFTLCNVAIGTSTATNRLDVVGNGKITGDFNITGTTTCASINASSTISSTGLNSTGVVNITSTQWGDGIFFNNGLNRIYADANTESVIVNIDVASNFYITSTGSEPLFFISGVTGFVGITNSNPEYNLDVTGSIRASSYCNMTWDMIANKPTFASVATSGSYNDLTNKPAFATVATSGSYTDLVNKPALCNVALSADYTDLINKPSLSAVATSGSYTDLTSKPTFAAIATSGSWNDLSDKPAYLSTVANNDLSNFSQTVVFQQKVGIGKNDPTYALDITGAVSATSYCNFTWNMINNPPLAPVSYSGSYDDLTTKPTQLSYFTNDIANFTCNVGIKQPSPEYTLHVNGEVYATAYCNLDWSMIQNRPDYADPKWIMISDRPSNLSFFNNDLSNFTNPLQIANYISALGYCNLTWDMVQGKPILSNIATTGSWLDVIGRPTALTQFTNDLVTFNNSIGIKISNPQYDLHVSGSLFATAYCNINWNDINGKPAFCNVATTGSYVDLFNKPTDLSDFNNDLSSFSASTVSFDGKVGIKTSSPDYELQVLGAISATSYCNIQWSMIQNAPNVTDYNSLANIPALCNLALTSSYDDLVGKPTLATVAISGSYTDLTNKPTLSVVASTGSYNDLVGKPALCNIATSGAYTDLVNAPQLSTVATSGAYSDLSGKPSLCNISLTSDWNDLNNIPSFKTVAYSGLYSDLSNVPSLCNIATTGNWNDLNNVPVFATVALSGSYTDLQGRPSLCNISISASYNDLIDVPVFSTVAASGSYTDLIDKPVLSTVAFTGSYDDLDNKPPGLSFSGSYNDLTDKPSLALVSITGKYIDLQNRPVLSSVATTGAYVDLIGTPLLSAVAVSGSWTDILDKPTLALVASSGLYDDLSNLPELKPVATSGLYTDIDGIPALCNIAITADYADLTNTPVLETVATSGLYADLINKPALCNIATTSLYADIADAPTTLSELSNNLTTFKVNNLTVRDDATILSVGCTSAVATLNLGASTEAMTVNVGTGGLSNKIINIGGIGDTINIPGTYNIVNTTNTSTCNTNIILNAGGSVGSSGGAGILIQEGVDTESGYIRLSGDRNSFLFKTPTSHVLSVDLENDCVNLASNAIFINSNSYIGINTNTPEYTLDVNGTLNATNIMLNGSPISIGGGFTPISGNKAYTMCNIGININDPQYPLHVSGTIYATTMVATTYSNVSYTNIIDKPTLSTVATSGSYNDLSNKPNLSSIAYSGCNTWANVNGKPTFASVAYSGAYSDLTGRPSICNIALTGMYVDLIGKPLYSTVASTGSYIDLTDTPTLCNVALSGLYTDLAGRPLLSNIATTGQWADIYGVPSFSVMAYTGCNTWSNLLDKPTLCNVATTGLYNDLSGIPTFSPLAYPGSNTWTNIESKPTFASVATSGLYSDLTGTPALATVATTGSYTDLTGLPIFSAITYPGSNTWANIDGKPSFCNVATTGNYNDLNNIPNLSTVAVSGAYTDLSGKPDLSAIAYNGSNTWSNLSGKPSFCNIATSGSYNDLTDKPSYSTVASTGSYTDLINKPSLAAIAYTGSNTWNNLTGKPSFATVATSGSYLDLTDSPALSTIATSGAYTDLVGAPSLASIAYSGCNTWSNLTGKPSFCNIATSALYSDLVGVPSFSPLAYSGCNVWANITNRPTALSQFTNDINYYEATMAFCNLVGIKTNNPLYDLDVRGTINACNILINGASLASSISTGYWQMSSNTIYTYSNALIENQTGTSAVSIIGTNTTTSSAISVNCPLIVGMKSSRAVANGFGVGIAFTAARGSNDGISRPTSYITSYLESGAGTNADTWGLKFINRNDDTDTLAMTILPNGNVGIGSTSPRGNLDVNGSIYATSYCNLTWSMVSGKPTFTTVATTGLYSDLSNLPSLSALAYTGSNTWANISGVPAFATIAYTGAWSNLMGTPPALSTFTNDLTTFNSKVTFNSNIQFSNTIENRKITLFESANNSHQFYGFGVNNSILRYQVWSTVADHVFYTGVNSTSSTELMRIKGNGNVGIGSSTVNDKLHVFNGNFRIDGSVSPTIRLHSSSSNNENGGEIMFLESNANDGFKIRSDTQSNAINILKMDSSLETSKLWISTNVGVKTTNPLYDFEVSGAVYATTYCNVNYNDLINKPVYSSVATTGAYADLTGKPTVLTQFTNNLSSFSCNVAFNGTVAIGGVAGEPTATLEVNGSVKCSSLSITGSNLSLQNITSSGNINMGCDNTTTTINIGCPTLTSQTINIGTTTSTSTINIGGSTDAIVVSGATLSLNSSLLTSSSAILSLNQSGISSSGSNCGIQIFENSVATGYIKTSNDRNSFLLKTPGGDEMSLNLSGSAININNNALVITGQGVGIGTASPTQSLDVNGSVRCAAVLTTSDQTLKEDISVLRNPIDKIKGIDAVYYKWKNKLDTDTHIGVLAQQVQEVLPEAVRESSSGMAVDYNAVLALAIAAIKEQQDQLNEQNKLIQKLLSHIEI